MASAQFSVFILLNVVLLPHFGKSGQQSESHEISSNITTGIDAFDALQSKVNHLEQELYLFMKQTNDKFHEMNDTINPDYPDIQLTKIFFNNHHDGCGGIVVAQTGRIPRSITSSSPCTWIIQVNHRSIIRLSFSQAGSYATCHVKEIIFNDGGLKTHSFTSTRVSIGNSYTFRGPLIYLSCLGNRIDGQSFTQVHFEGIGRKILTNVNFRYVINTEKKGSFLYKPENRSDTGYEMEFTTIVFPSDIRDNERDLVIERFYPNITCKYSSLMIYPDFPNDTRIDCCAEDCERMKFLINGDYPPTLVMLTRDLKPTADNSSALSLAWSPHRSLSSGKGCGGAVSGRGGILDLSGLIANQKCVWSIQPFPRTEVFMEKVHTGYGSSVKSWETFEILQIGGGGKIEWSSQSRIDGSFIGRVIILTFISNVTHRDYRVKWKAVGGYNPSNIFLQHDKILQYTKSDGKDILRMPISSNLPGWHVAIISPLTSGETSNASLEIELKLIKLEGNANLYLIGSDYSNFDLLLYSNSTTKTESVFAKSYSNWNRIFVIVTEIFGHGDSSTFAVQWKMGTVPRADHYVGCGGLITETKDIYITYDPVYQYHVNERCIWLINCPYAKVFLKLTSTSQRPEFEHLLLIDFVDWDQGRLMPNDTRIISWENREQSFPGPLLIATFQSNIRAGNGITFRITGSGKRLNETTPFRLIHSHDLGGDFTYPLTSASNKSTVSEEIIIFANNRNYSEITAAKIVLQLEFFEKMQNYFRLSVYFNNEKYRYEEVAFCELEYLHVSGETCWLKYPYVEIPEVEAASSNMTVEKTYRMNFYMPSFLSIYKPGSLYLPPFKLNLKWDIDRRCGGIITAPHGSISYGRPDSTYHLPLYAEQCIWIVDTSSAGKSAIIFQLNYDGLTWGYDYNRIIVRPLFVENATLGPVQLVNRDWGTYNTVSSPIAIFTLELDAGQFGLGFGIKFRAVDETNSTSLFSRLPPVRLIHYSKKENTSELMIPTPIRDGELIIMAVVPRLRKDGGNVTLFAEGANLTLGGKCNAQVLSIYGSRGINDSYYRDLANVYYNGFQDCNSTDLNNSTEVEILESYQDSDNGFNMLSNFTLSTPFIVMIKSVSGFDNVGNNSGFRIHWNSLDKTNSPENDNVIHANMK